MAVKNSIPSQLHNSVNQNFRFTTAHSTNLQTVFTNPAGEEKETQIRSILINNLETSTRIVHFYINNGTDDFFIGSSNVVPIFVSPLNGRSEVIAGLTSPLLNRVLIDEKGNPFLRILPGEVLKARLSAAVTVNNNVIMSVTGSNFER